MNSYKSVLVEEAHKIGIADDPQEALAQALYNWYSTILYIAFRCGENSELYKSVEKNLCFDDLSAEEQAAWRQEVAAIREFLVDRSGRVG